MNLSLSPPRPLRRTAAVGAIAVAVILAGATGVDAGDDPNPLPPLRVPTDRLVSPDEGSTPPLQFDRRVGDLDLHDLDDVDDDVPTPIAPLDELPELDLPDPPVVDPVAACIEAFTTGALAMSVSEIDPGVDVVLTFTDHPDCHGAIAVSSYAADFDGDRRGLISTVTPDIDEIRVDTGDRGMLLHLDGDPCFGIIEAVYLGTTVAAAGHGDGCELTVAKTFSDAITWPVEFSVASVDDIDQPGVQGLSADGTVVFGGLASGEHTVAESTGAVPGTRLGLDGINLQAHDGTPVVFTVDGDEYVAVDNPDPACIPYDPTLYLHVLGLESYDNHDGTATAIAWYESLLDFCDRPLTLSSYRSDAAGNRLEILALAVTSIDDLQAAPGEEFRTSVPLDPCYTVVELVVGAGEQIFEKRYGDGCAVTVHVDSPDSAHHAEVRLAPSGNGLPELQMIDGDGALVFGQLPSGDYTIAEVAGAVAGTTIDIDGGGPAAHDGTPVALHVAGDHHVEIVNPAAPHGEPDDRPTPPEFTGELPATR